MSTRWTENNSGQAQHPAYGCNMPASEAGLVPGIKPVSATGASVWGGGQFDAAIPFHYISQFRRHWINHQVANHVRRANQAVSFAVLAGGQLFSLLMPFGLFTLKYWPFTGNLLPGHRR